jgi:hypothetical protein
VLAYEKCDTGGDFDPNRTNFSYPRVPEGLDWISLDYYPDEGTLEGVPLLFKQHVYPKMSAEQKALFVPPAYGSDAADAERLCCNNSTRDGPNVPCHGDCSMALLQWAKGSYDWARKDSRIVGLNPWYAASSLARLCSCLCARARVGADALTDGHTAGTTLRMANTLPMASLSPECRTCLLCWRLIRPSEERSSAGSCEKSISVGLGGSNDWPLSKSRPSGARSPIESSSWRGRAAAATHLSVGETAKCFNPILRSSCVNQNKHA